jgi:hypothetical protein
MAGKAPGLGDFEAIIRQLQQLLDLIDQLANQRMEMHRKQVTRVTQPQVRVGDQIGSISYVKMPEYALNGDAPPLPGGQMRKVTESVTVTEVHGAYGTRKEAEAAAARIARSTGKTLLVLERTQARSPGRSRNAARTTYDVVAVNDSRRSDRFNSSTITSFTPTPISRRGTVSTPISYTSKFGVFPIGTGNVPIIPPPVRGPGTAQVKIGDVLANENTQGIRAPSQVKVAAIDSSWISLAGAEQRVRAASKHDGAAYGIVQRVTGVQPPQRGVTGSAGELSLGTTTYDVVRLASNQSNFTIGSSNASNFYASPVYRNDTQSTLIEIGDRNGIAQLAKKQEPIFVEDPIKPDPPFEVVGDIVAQVIPPPSLGMVPLPPPIRVTSVLNVYSTRESAEAAATNAAAKTGKSYAVLERSAWTGFSQIPELGPGGISARTVAWDVVEIGADVDPRMAYQPVNGSYLEFKTLGSKTDGEQSAVVKSIVTPAGIGRAETGGSVPVGLADRYAN